MLDAAAVNPTFLSVFPSRQHPEANEPPPPDPFTIDALCVLELVRYPSAEWFEKVVFK